ncbi:hypothetical protein M427DRAFT_47044 [Gonapodya prolifera JEL478]|uniref:Transcription factor domain-containing protein n=1 Tax=Gonapodya prolifera (strain JEL478) TaxID=1344416 RepID=A0A139A4J8_GONPJ|nr:hypothetical protein M427DRAFT_47044 [Gonapodya prolifera JEL478]|eukprot:KXS11518.1 hypothetical protein M427DRAFT_47044 [Gonapodya prolifera JEL478]
MKDKMDEDGDDALRKKRDRTKKGNLRFLRSDEAQVLRDRALLPMQQAPNCAQHSTKHNNGDYANIWSPNRPQSFQKPLDEMDSSDSSSDNMLIHENGATTKNSPWRLTPTLPPPHFSQTATQISDIQHSIPDAIPLFADLPPLPSQEIWNLLIGLYFGNVWPGLPCVDKTRFLRDCATYPPILTYSIYACTTRFCEDPSIDYCPHLDSTPNFLLIWCAQLLPTVFDMRRPSVHPVQAILKFRAVGIAMVLARIVGLSSEGGGGKSEPELWNRGIATIAQGGDMAIRKMDEMRRTWYCYLAWNRFAGMMEPRTWTTAMDEGRDVRVPPPSSGSLGPAQLAATPPESDELMSLYSNIARVVEFRQCCNRKGSDPCDVAIPSGIKLYPKLRHLDGILVEWYTSLPKSRRPLKRKVSEERVHAHQILCDARSRTPNPSCLVIAPGIDPATVAARETRELSIFLRAVHMFRKWWVPKSEVQPKQSLFKRIFCEIWFPMEGMPVLSSIVQNKGQERAAKMGAVVIVREQDVSDFSSRGPLGGPRADYSDGRSQRADPTFTTAGCDRTGLIILVWGPREGLQQSLRQSVTHFLVKAVHLGTWESTDVDRMTPRQKPLGAIVEVNVALLLGGIWVLR